MLIICGLVGLLFALKMTLAMYFTRRLRTQLLERASVASNAAEISNTPPAAIIVCLRGADPGLRESLIALMRQDYPDYELRIIVDHIDDPAWRIAHEAVAAAEFLRAKIEVLRDRLPTCSLKCSALVQAVESLDDSRELIALADADVRADENWLKHLVAPFADSKVGLTFGNRWFQPTSARIGSLVRYVWNAAAVLYISRCDIPWAGSMVIRRSALIEAGIVDKWKRAICDDTAAGNALEQRGYRAEFVPQLVLVNEEDCTLGFCLRFMTRQLAWVRLYHRGWRKIRRHAIISTTQYISVLLLATIGIAQSRFGLVAFAAACYFARMVGMAMNFRNIETGIHAHLPAEGGNAKRGWWRGFKIALATPLADAFHLIAVAKASTQRNFTWRGVKYRVDGPTRVRRLDYAPYHATSPRAAETNHSI